MVTSEKFITAAEFFEMARVPQNRGRRLELDDGVIVEIASSHPINTVVAGIVLTRLNNHVRPRKLGYVSAPDGGYKLATGRVRQPDVAFISKARYKTLPDEFEGGPDIAVEIVSPNEDVLKKAHEYLASGTKLVWAIYPDEQTVHILRATGTRWEVLGIDDQLTGEAVLPEFTVHVRELFPEED